MNAMKYFWESKGTLRKVFITIALVAFYRILIHIPLSGISTTPAAIRQNILPGSGLYTFIDFLGMLSGSSLLRVSVLSLGLLPYNVTSVILYLFVPLIPGVERRLKFDPREGQLLLEKWNYYLAIPIAGLMSFSFIFFISPNCEGRFLLLEGQGASLDLLLTLTTVSVLTAGSFFAVWISSLISEFGIRGKGNAILITSGILGQLPDEIVRLLDSPKGIWALTAYGVLFFGCIILIVFLLNGKRNVAVVYPGRRVSARMSSGLKGSLPIHLSIGSDGLIGSQLIVAMATFYAPLATCSSTQWINAAAIWLIDIFGEESLYFGPMAFFSVVIFSIFHAQVTFQEQNFAENLRRSGAFIPGVNPGKRTQDYLDNIVRRVSFVPALLLGFLAIAPWIFNAVLGVSLSLLDGEKLLILVATIRDIFFIIEVDLKMTGYERSPLIR